MRTAFARIGNALFLLAFVGLLGWGGLQAHSADAALKGRAVAAGHCDHSPIDEHCDSDSFCEDKCQEAGFTSGHCAPDDCCLCYD